MTKKLLKKILLAEDEPDIRAIAKIGLEVIGNFTVLFCESGQETLLKVEEFNPDLIVLDVMMPGLDGIQTYKALREKPTFANTPIIFMTAKIQPDEIKQYLTMGAIGVINKPFDPTKLAETMLNMWDKSENAEYFQSNEGKT